MKSKIEIFYSALILLWSRPSFKRAKVGVEVIFRWSCQTYTAGHIKFFKLNLIFFAEAIVKLNIHFKVCVFCKDALL